ncbi:aminotransferase class I/II-fold pyridoxal phosphate-dependent enzyme [Paenibacillus sp. BK720]|uniref:aminotransferase class I/II-fold pyridoxal phosphate-dependent enzyme n=1 Tax=Paenibacillus sp. BK720 TaxID=2587092 RepID=UPI0014205946|nr:aminotransferase class I/II-fold pyridoxal phosphate-dependent enzyme [Paenibacillus sp. BK720]NIK66834.1 LL-diaminopimelate aminotransferase [Paenibacillus sp. BK720]
MRKSWRSERLSQLGSSIFAEVAEWKAEAAGKGRDIINLGIGSPDKPPTEAVRKALSEAALRTDIYSYPGTHGSTSFRRQAAAWMEHRFGVKLDPDRELVSLMGSQDGLSHLAMSLCNPGDMVIVPNPGYPIYTAALALAGVEPYLLPLKEENHFLPDLDSVPKEVWERAKFILLNYPGNPVSATTDLAFFERLLAKAKSHGVLVVHDAAYSEMAFDGHEPPSVLAVPGALDGAVEFHSLSKSFNMAGCRIGFLAGNREAVGALRELKENIDYGVFGAVQEAGVAALQEAMSASAPPKAGVLYEQRRDSFIAALAVEGWAVEKPKATMFVWAKLPERSDGTTWTSREFARSLLDQTGVVVIPGEAFGSEGEGFVRIALVEDEARLREAARRIGAFLRG